MSKKKKLYIAGPVTGVKDYQERFENAKFALDTIYYKAFEIITPVDLCKPNWSWTRSMVKCLWNLVRCDGVYFLSGWEASKGATIEHKVAKALKIPIFYF